MLTCPNTLMSASVLTEEWILMVLQLDMLQYKVSVVQDQRLLSRLAQSNTSKLQRSGGGGGAEPEI